MASMIERVPEGTKLKCTVEDNMFEGVVHSVDRHRHLLTLENVLDLKSGDVNKLIRLSVPQITEWKIVDDIGRKKKKSKLSNRLVDMCLKEPVNHLMRFKNIDYDYLADSWKLGTDSKSTVDSTSNGDNGKPSIASGCDQEDAYVIIDEFYADFFDAIKVIESQSVIGLAVQGISIGRSGSLCWLQVATGDMCYFFDILKLGVEAFDNGLKGILQSRSIQKVVYNCRFVSDMFYHQFDTLLDNVFDVQVAETVLFRRQNGGHFPQYVGSLAACCMKYLGLPSVDVFFQRTRLYNRQKDESVWTHRPATCEMLVALRKNVVYLRQLRRLMMESLLSHFVQGVDAYLHAHRSRPDHSIDYEELVNGGSNQLPSQLVMLMSRLHVGKNLATYSAFIDNYDRGSRDPFIHLSHDSISHGSKPDNRSTPVSANSYNDF